MWPGKGLRSKEHPLREEFYPPDFSDARVCVMFLHGLLRRQGEDEPSSIRVKFGGVGARFIAPKGWGRRVTSVAPAACSPHPWDAINRVPTPSRHFDLTPQGEDKPSPISVKLGGRCPIYRAQGEGQAAHQWNPRMSPHHPWDAINRVPTPSRHLYLGKMGVRYGDD